MHRGSSAQTPERNSAALHHFDSSATSGLGQQLSSCARFHSQIVNTLQQQIIKNGSLSLTFTSAERQQRTFFGNPPEQQLLNNEPLRRWSYEVQAIRYHPRSEIPH